jgi:hypothetical protein
MRTPNTQRRSPGTSAATITALTLAATLTACSGDSGNLDGTGPLGRTDSPQR